MKFETENPLKAQNESDMPLPSGTKERENAGCGWDQGKRKFMKGKESDHSSDHPEQTLSQPKFIKK